MQRDLESTPETRTLHVLQLVIMRESSVMPKTPEVISWSEIYVNIIDVA